VARVAIGVPGRGAHDLEDMQGIPWTQPLTVEDADAGATHAQFDAR
jgi:hypothetical protein